MSGWVAATPCAMPLTAREAWGAGLSSTDRKKDDGAAGQQNSGIKQSDLVSFNPEEEPRRDAESSDRGSSHPEEEASSAGPKMLRKRKQGL